MDTEIALLNREIDRLTSSCLDLIAENEALRAQLELLARLEREVAALRAFRDAVENAAFVAAREAA